MLTGAGKKVQIMDRENYDGYEIDSARQESLLIVSQHAEKGGQVWDLGLTAFSLDFLNKQFWSFLRISWGKYVE